MFDRSNEVNDLADLFTKGNADNGVWKQVVMHGKKWNLEVKILGADSDEVQNYNRTRVKELQKHINIAGGKNVDLDDEAMDSMLENGVEEALVRFVGIRRVSDGKELELEGQVVPAEKTKECEKVYGNILVGMPALKDFIMRESSERSNFLSNGKKN